MIGLGISDSLLGRGERIGVVSVCKEDGGYGLSGTYGVMGWRGG